jgi:hypothetical protein
LFAVLIDDEKDQYRNIWYNKLCMTRCGPFDEARDDIKDAFFKLQMYLVPVVAKNWRPNLITKKGLTYSELVTDSDEIFTIMTVERNIKSWMERRHVAGRAPKNGWSATEIKDFFRRQIRLSKERHEKPTGKDWDDGFIEYYNSLHPTKNESKEEEDSVDNSETSNEGPDQIIPIDLW